MNKNQFLLRLDAYLYNLPPQNRQNILRYFRDKIEKATSDGADEKEYINSLGFVPNIAKEITEDYHKNNPRYGKVSPLKTAVLVLLSPLIIALIFTVIIIIFSTLLLGASLFFSSLMVIFMSPFIAFGSIYAAFFTFGMGLVLMGGGLFAVTATGFIAVYFFKLCMCSFNSLKEYIKKGA